MYERILIPLDGSKVGESALPYVEELISKLSPEVKVEVTLLRVIPSGKIPMIVGGEEGVPVVPTAEETEQNRKAAMDYLEWAGEGLRNKGVMVMATVSIGDASAEIVKTAEEIQANLIAMSTHGRSGLSRWAFGSVTDKVLRREGKIPIIMVKASGKE